MSPGKIAIHELAWAAGRAVVRQHPLLVPVHARRRGTASSRGGGRRSSPALAPEDRCHLNGLGLRDGRPRYVTALGETDEPAGWRANKASGGCLIDVASGEVIARGLSMPHSPRWHDGRLWVCESGAGSLGVRRPNDRASYETVALVPGFTRGLDFVGPFAFVGLSQVRESAVFSGIPITERLPGEERNCGVWVIDPDPGRSSRFLRFEAGVQEVFAVQVLPGIRYPDVLTADQPAVANSFMIPDEALADVQPPPTGG